MIQDAIRQAQSMHRQVIEAAYDGMCSVYEKHRCKDPKTKVTGTKEVIVMETQPCHLSYLASPVTAPNGLALDTLQEIKLFLTPEADIKPGSRVEVTQNGHTESYRRSGKAAVYASHQEILLELWKERA